MEKDTDLALKKINEFIFSEYVLNNTNPFNEYAADGFLLVAAPGMIESKKLGN